MSSRLLLLSVTILVQTGQTITAQQSFEAVTTLQRRYTDGVVSHYQMTGDNEGWQYTIRATDTVRRDANGRYYEDIRWSDLTSNARQALTPASLAFQQTVSLDDPVSYMKVPNLADIQPLLVGPITDTLTIYSDLLLAMQSKLVQPGQTAYVSRSTPNSWADGQRVLIGQDVVDFSLKVETVNAAEHTEKLLIRHVPPPSLHVQLPAKWMQDPGSAKPDNFVQVSKQVNGFTADVGKETFDVTLAVDTRDGQILSAAIRNLIALRIRECTDRELTHCGTPVFRTTRRDITWKRVP